MQIRYVAIIAIVPALFAQSSAIRPGDWPRYSRDLASTRFSPLSQITTGNVAKLKTAWTYRLRSDAELARGGRGGGIGGYSQVTPIVVNDVMYITAGNRVLALDPDTGKEIWKYEVTGGNPSARGVTYWPGDANNPARIIFTAGRRMIGLNAKHRQNRSGLRQGRRGGSGGSVQFGSDDLQEHAVRRRERARAAGDWPARRHARATTPAPARRCGIFTPCRSPASPATKPGRRRLEGSHRSQQLGLLHDGR